MSGEGGLAPTWEQGRQTVFTGQLAATCRMNRRQPQFVDVRRKGRLSNLYGVLQLHSCRPTEPRPAQRPPPTSCSRITQTARSAKTHLDPSCLPAKPPALRLLWNVLSPPHWSTWQCSSASNLHSNAISP